MSLFVAVCLVYCTSLLWTVLSVAAKTNQGECKHNLSGSHQISVDSHNFSTWGYDKCEYYISAPKHHIVQLNFTKIFGFTGTDKMCRPKLSIDGMTDSAGNNETTIEGVPETPLVFQSLSNSIRIIYMLNKCQRDSGFSLSFNFLRKENKCVFHCDSSKCLPATSLCDGTHDCFDKSDEQVGKCTNTRSDHIPYIVIGGLLVLLSLLGVVVCLAKHNNCKIMSRVRQRPSGRDGQRPQSQVSEVMEPSPTHEQIESLLPDRYNQLHSGYPPHVPRSKDGEEGYRESQKDILNHRQNSSANWECFRAAPNKTVYDLENPPPPYSLESPHRSSHSPFSKTPPPPLQNYNGCAVIRCYSMSGSATAETRPSLCSTSHSRTYSSSVGRSSGGGGSVMGRLPSYAEARGGHGQGRGSVSSSVRSSPPDYQNSFSVTSADLYRSSSSDNANV